MATYRRVDTYLRNSEARSAEYSPKTTGRKRPELYAFKKTGLVDPISGKTPYLLIY